MKIGDIEFNNAFCDLGLPAFRKDSFSEALFSVFALKVPKEISYISPSLTKKDFPKSRNNFVLKYGAGMMAYEKDSLFGNFDAGLINLSKFNKPIIVSLVPMGGNDEERLADFQNSLASLKERMETSNTPFLVLITCEEGKTEDVMRLIKIAEEQSVKCTIRCSVLVAPSDAKMLLFNQNVHALFLDGPMGWENLPAEAKKIFFRSENSPIVSGGVVSGKYLFPLAVEWLAQLRPKDIGKPVIVGYVLRPREINELKEAGASGVNLSDTVMLRPWNVGRMTKRALEIF